MEIVTYFALKIHVNISKLFCLKKKNKKRKTKKKNPDLLKFHLQISKCMQATKFKMFDQTFNFLNVIKFSNFIFVAHFSTTNCFRWNVNSIVFVAVANTISSLSFTQTLWGVVWKNAQICRAYIFHIFFFCNIKKKALLHKMG